MQDLRNNLTARGYPFQANEEQIIQDKGEAIFSGMREIHIFRRMGKQNFKHMRRQNVETQEEAAHEKYRSRNTFMNNKKL